MDDKQQPEFRVDSPLEPEIVDLIISGRIYLVPRNVEESQLIRKGWGIARAEDTQELFDDIDRRYRGMERPQTPTTPGD